MGLLTVDKWVEFQTVASIDDIATVVKGEGQDYNAYLPWRFREAIKAGGAKIEWSRLASSSIDDAFGGLGSSNNEPEIQVVVQYLLRKSPVVPWSLQIYASDRDSHREVQLRIMGGRGDANAAAKLAQNIRAALT